MDQINKFMLKQVLLLMFKDHFKDLPRQGAKGLAEIVGKPEMREEFEDHLIETFKTDFEKLAVEIDRIVEKNLSEEAYIDAEREITAALKKAADNPTDEVPSEDAGE